MSSLQYVSTRQPAGDNTALGFEDVLLAGLAPDGGLYVPTEWPHFSKDRIRSLRGLDYPHLATEIILPFVGDSFTKDELLTLLTDAYVGFDHKAVAPLKQLAHGQFVAELFHGPTLAFKDFALQVLGRLFDTVLARRKQRITIVGATSGDTGSAAIEACRDRENIDIVILYPEGRTSDIQRRQMTTVNASNVHTLAVAGTFDDCQDLVKALFADAEFRARHQLSAVNSINWARVMAQIVYYFWAGMALGAPDVPVAFSVPTGNFGNILAGHAARLMGLPISSLTIATNRNDILYRFVETGEMRINGVEPSLSPSMDIQVSSNFERLFHEVLGRDGAKLAEAMAAFRKNGLLPATQAAWDKVREGFQAYRVDDEETRATIRTLHAETGELFDPHSAIAVEAMRRHVAKQPGSGVPHVALATAHPAKFPETVTEAIGLVPMLPPHMADLMTKPERITRIANDFAAVRAFVDAHCGPQKSVPGKGRA
ncbi:MAG TPA: threonine synthase [Stellaceae bacterium]|nr:threonine synthase [Stellaceae bacterium]